jgi:hypothetical protein
MPSCRKTILSLCDFTGEWSRPYKESDYYVIQVDLELGQDVRLMNFIDGEVHGILAAPPCTVFANSGARWLRSEADMLEGLSVVDACLRMVAVYAPKWWVIENPIGKLNHYIGKPKMYFNPCDYGDPYTKRTALWGNFNTDLPRNEVEPTEGSKMHTQYGGKSARTKAMRSITPAGFARAFFEANP